MSQLIISNNYLSGIREEMDAQLRSWPKYQKHWRQIGVIVTYQEYLNEIGENSSFRVERTDQLSVQLAGGYGSFLVFGAACVRVVPDTELVEALLRPWRIVPDPKQSSGLGLFSVLYVNVTAPDWEVEA